MASVGTLIIDIATDTAKVVTGINDTKQELGKLRTATNNINKQMEKSIIGVRKAWLQAAAAVVAVKGAWDVAEMSAKAEQQKVAFSNLAASYGQDSDMLINKLRDISDQTIDTATMINRAGTAMMMGIAPDEIVKLMEIARATARMTGQDVSAAFSDISLAVGRQSKMILDNLGIIVSVEKANQDYAAQLGKTSKELSDAERKQAFMNATIKGGSELMETLGEQSGTTTDKMEQFAALCNDIKIVLGGAVINATLKATATFQWLAAGVLEVLAGFKKLQVWSGKLSDWTGATKGEAAKRMNELALLQEEAMNLVAKAAENWNTKSQELTAEQLANLQKIRDRQQADADAFEAQQQVTAEAEKKRQEDKKNLQKLQIIAEQELTQELARRSEVLDEILDKRRELVDTINDAVIAESAGGQQLQTDEVLGGLGAGAAEFGNIMAVAEGEDPYSEQIRRTEETYEALSELNNNYWDTTVSAEENFRRRRESLDAISNRKQIAIEKLANRQKLFVAQNTFGAMASVAQAYYAASDQQSRLALQAYKAFAIAEATVSTIRSVMAAIAWGTEMGSPYLGAALGAAAAAVGAANIAAIASMQVGSNGAAASAGAATSTGSVASSSASSTPIGTETSQQETVQPRDVRVTFNIYGDVVDHDEFARKVIPSIQKAYDDGVR